MNRIFALIVIFATCGSALMAQHNLGSSALLHDLKKLQNSSRVLYLAAHPDDENTKMISWLVNERNIPTAYLSLTRGDGGQNLIGKELGAALGVLRTQELMQARATDGGQQYFTRAVDFGYSKTAEESFDKWNKTEILKDVVWVIRKYRPDVIITRFPPDGYGGHGHHTASAILAVEAFDLAADKNAFPEQLTYVNTWQPKRLYWNASSWWNPKLDSIAKVDDNYLEVKTGGYNPLLGYSSNELASLSRTQHKSQGFGVSISRGEDLEYLKYFKGDKAAEDIMEGINSDWERFGYAEADRILEKIITEYDVNHPSRSLPLILELKKGADAITDEGRRESFQRSLDQIILRALGIHAEARLNREYVSQGEKVDIEFEVLNRAQQWNQTEVKLKSVTIGGNEVLKTDQLLVYNQPFTDSISMTMPEGNTAPYWLQEEYGSLFSVKDQQLVGKPENDIKLGVELVLSVGGQELRHSIPLIHKYSDRVEGEIVHQVQLIPAVTLSTGNENLIFTSDKAQELLLDLRFNLPAKAEVKLSAKGWTIEPAQFTLEADKSGVHRLQKVSISPGPEAGNAEVQIDVNGQPARELQEIAYDHMEKRILLNPVSPQLVKIDLQKRGEVVGYIPGAGDNVAEAIQLMGYNVEILDEQKLKTTDLSKYQAIIAGIRAYNTEEWLPAMKQVLEEYIRQGGNYIVQYNTASRDLLSRDFGPYPFELSRERVSEEDADAEFLLPQHPVLNHPNNLSEADFKNWVQERGLYFASKWDEKYAAPIGWNDRDEPQRKGGLIIADHGDGAFIYTGISFFRQLPAGVSGAYRLLANLISYDNANHEQ